MANITEATNFSDEIITIDQITAILREKGIKVDDEDFGEGAGSVLFDFLNANGRYKSGRKFTLDEARKFLNRAKNATILLGQLLPQHQLDELVKTIRQLDKETIESLDKLYGEAFELYGGDLVTNTEGKSIKATDKLAKSISKIATTVIGEGSARERRFITDELDRLSAAFFIYKQLKPCFVSKWNKKTLQVEREVDKHVLDIVSLKDFKKATLTQTREIFDALTRNLGVDTLSKHEMAELLTHTNTVITQSSKSKIEKFQECVKKYREYLISLAGDDKKFERLVNENVTFKNLILKSGSVLKINEDTQEQIFDMLTGMDLRSISIKHKIRLVNHDARAIKGVENFKLNFTPKELFYTLVNNPSLFVSASPSKAVSIAIEFNKIVDELFPKGSEDSKRLDRNDFKIEEFATGRNFVDLFSFPPNNTQNYVENIKTLNKVMRSSQVFKVMQGNHMLFMCDSNVIKARMDKIISDCNGDIGQLAVQINDFINENFANVTLNDISLDQGKSKKQRGMSEELKEFFTQTPIQVEVDGGIEKVAKPTAKRTTRLSSRTVKKTKDNKVVDADNIQEDNIDKVTDDKKASTSTKRVKTFSDTLKDADVSDKCINLLKKEVEELKTMLKNVNDVGEIEMKDAKHLNTEDVLGVKIKHIAKLSNKAYELLSKEDSGFIKDLKEGALQDCMDDIKSVYEEVYDKVKNLKSLITVDDIKRGKKASKTTDEAEELMEFMYTMETSAKQVKNEKNKRLITEALLSIREKTKDDIISSQKSVNKSRVENYDEAMKYLKQYSTFNKVLKGLEQEFSQFNDEQSFAK